MAVYPPWDLVAAQQIIEQLQHVDGATLPILHALQDHFGYIDPAAIPLIAEALNLSRADIHGTVSFYHDFRTQPPGRRVIKLCRAEACQAVGSEDLVDHLAQQHGIALDSTSPAGDLTIETVYCLGNCALGPSALVDGHLRGRLDAGQLERICGVEARP